MSSFDLKSTQIRPNFRKQTVSKIEVDHVTVTVGFWCQTIHEKFLQRFDTIFGLKMMVKSGLEKNILKFNDGLQRLLPNAKKSAQNG